MSARTAEEVEGAVEAVHSALINLDNMVTLMPVLKRHPLLPLVRMQLTEACKMLGRDVSEDGAA